MLRLRHGAVASVVFSVAAASGQSAPVSFAGANRCLPCHPSQFREQGASAHARALYRIEQHPLARSFPVSRQLARGRDYQFEFLCAPPAFRVRIFDRVDVMDLPVEWAFGAGRQAVTFVTRVNREWYIEHYATYYSALHSYGATPGQDAVKAKSLPDAAGLLYPISDPDRGIAGCFECHSTGPVTFGSDGGVRLTESGVRCEACHGAGDAHAGNPRRHRLQNPGKFSAERLSVFCGRCHRPPAAAGVQIDWDYAWNVRHQPLYLNESRCFRNSGGRLSCLTCHAPHEPAGKKLAAYYNRRCAGCHTDSGHPPKPVCFAREGANCVDCHMPVVSPQPPLRFTNHRIGIYRDGGKLRPCR